MHQTDETKRQIVDSHIIKALSEISAAHHRISRADFTAEVQRRVTEDIGRGLSIHDRVEEVLDTLMTPDDSA